MLDAARQAAENAILDRRVLTFSAKSYAEFIARLDGPPAPNERLLRSLETTVPWK